MSASGGFRAAVIGCGFFGGLYEDFDHPRCYSHAKGYARDIRFTSIACVDPDAERRERVAGKAGGACFASLTALAAHAPFDAISVVVPDAAHFTVTQELLSWTQPPRVIFLEKPACTTPEELHRLSAMSAQRHVPILVNHSRRFDPAHRRIAGAIATGVFGVLRRVDSYYYGGWQHLAVHLVDLLQWFFDDQIVLGQARFACADRSETDPTLDVFGHIRGAPVQMIGCDERDFQILDVQCLFTNALLRLTDFGQTITVLQPHRNADGERVLVENSDLSGPGMIAPMPAAIDRIARFLSDGDATALQDVSLAAAMQTMETLWKGRDLYAAQS